MPQYNLVGTGEPRDAIAEFDGMRVRATGGIGQLFESVGGVPTSVTSSEAYNAMESGVVDTVAFAQHAHLSFRTIDIADWWTENLNPGTVNCPVVVNTDAYAALSPEYQAILDEAVDGSIEYYLANYGELLERWDALLEERGVEIVTIPEAELALLAENAAPIHAAWIESMNSQGLPGQELYDLVLSTLEEYRANN
jgi:TRAP-type C4-dicarboxylate transport system substrate-binding protein